MSAAADWLARPMLLPLTEDRLEQVLEIERASYTYPWPRQVFLDCMRYGYSCRTLGWQDQVDVYGIMSIADAIQEAHIFNLCVRPQRRRSGLGRAMLHHLIGLAAERGATTMLLEVRPSNAAAISLYRSMRFRQVGLRRQYYRARDGREDALMLVRRLGRGAYPGRVRAPAKVGAHAACPLPR